MELSRVFSFVGDVEVWEEERSTYCVVRRRALPCGVGNIGARGQDLGIRGNYEVLNATCRLPPATVTFIAIAAAYCQLPPGWSGGEGIQHPGFA